MIDEIKKYDGEQAWIEFGHVWFMPVAQHMII